MNRETHATKTVVMTNRHGSSIIRLHMAVLKEYPGYFIRKSIVKR
jgi:hypothetical protein